MKTQTPEQIILAVLSNVDQRAASTARAALDALLEQHRKEIAALRSQDNERIDADAARIASLGESLLSWGTRTRNAETNLATIREVAESALNGVAQRGPIQVYGQVAEDVRALELTIDHACEDAVWEAKYSSTDRAALSRLQALAQESASLLAKVAELEESLAYAREMSGSLERSLAARKLEVDGCRHRVSMREKERDAIRADVERLKARGWIQCTTVSNECLGGCASMAEHDRYRHRELAHEVENLRPMVVLHEDLSQQLRLAESCLAAVRERSRDKKAILERALDGVLQIARWVADGDPKEYDGPGPEDMVEADTPNPSMPSNGSDTMSTAQQHAVMDETCDECGELGGQHRLLPVYRDELPRMCSKASHTAQHEDLQRMTGAKPTVLNTCICRDGTTEPCLAARHPCSDTCMHDDAATTGHPERVTERSEAALQILQSGEEQHSEGYNDGWRDAIAIVEQRVRKALENASAEVLAAIEGAAP